MLRRLVIVALVSLACTKPAAHAAPAIPPAIAPAFALLDSVLSPAQKDTLRRMLPDSAGLYHFTLGLFLRNEGGLWKGGPVAESLLARGVKQPDNMFGIILAAYGLYLRGKPIDLDSLVRGVRPDPTGFKTLHREFRDPSDTVTLQGVLIEGQFLGPPNYGENAATDRQDLPYLLQLPTSAENEKGTLHYSPAAEELMLETEMLVQLTIETPIDSLARKLVGKRVEVRGTLFDAEVGPQYTHVLMRVIKIRAIRQWHW
jgi:hypothetical protein